MNRADEFRATCRIFGLVKKLPTLVAELKLDPPSCPKTARSGKCLLLDSRATPDVQAFQLEGRHLVNRRL
jgi:hypothetical protein